MAKQDTDKPAVKMKPDSWHDNVNISNDFSLYHISQKMLSVFKYCAMGFVPFWSVHEYIET